MLTNQITVVIPPGIKDTLLLQCVEEFHQMSEQPDFLLWEMFHYLLPSNGFMLSDNKSRLTTDFQALITLVQQIQIIKSCKS
jgi:hypothetical protein